MTSKVTSHWFEAFGPLRQRILHHSGGVRFVLAGAVTLLCCLWTYRSIGIVYGINDDVGFAQIVSGAGSGTPDGHLVFVKYALGWTISRLYILNNHLDWYGLTMLGLLYLCLFLILFRALELTRTFSGGLRATGLVVAGYVLLGLQHFALFQFTTIAAVLAGTGIFWLYTSEPSTARRQFIDAAITVLLLLAGFMVRTNSFLLSVPFAVIVYLHRNLDWHSRLRLRQPMLPVAALMGIGVIVLIEQSAYADPAWKAYLHFNHLRSQLYDYCGLPTYDEHQALYESVGVSRETYQLLRLQVFALHDAGKSETLGALVDSCLGQQSLVTQRGWSSARISWQARDLLQQVSYPRFTAINIALIVLAGWAFIDWKPTFTYSDALFFLAFIAIHFGEWFYLVMNGRYPDRVIFAIYLIELTVLAALAMKSRSPQQGTAPPPYRLTVFLLATAILLGAAYRQAGVVQQQVLRQRASNRTCEIAAAYLARHPQFFYFRAPGSFGTCTKTFKIQANNRFLNYASLGGWGFSSPLLLQNWSRHGITDVQHDLIARDDVFILAVDPNPIQYLVDYYHSISVNAVATEVERIGTGMQTPDLRVFRLHVLQDSPSR
jgi:hypothetical protein